MLFNSALYGAFLVATFAIFWSLRTRRIPRAVFLVAASYGFYVYGTWDVARSQDIPLGPGAWSFLCLAILVVGSTLDFWVARLLARTVDPRARRALLLASLVYYLGVLSLFKYWNFAADSLADVARLFGVHPPAALLHHVRLVLPFGISFFTFETMSYTIDVYRRELEPCQRYLDYLLFVSFFPHLVAGPIVRPAQMLPQLARRPVADADAQARGLFLIATGLAKKIGLGDLLAINLVERVFDSPERFSSLEILVAVYGYAFQIYCDFSGYTDVALGSALLFGYELPPNFDRPYTSKNLTDFWRRWHISLSSWLRDYLYIPLGGSRHGAVKTYRNLMITMLLGGLWHGASWTFVVWGGLHGVALALNRMVDRARERRRRRGDGDAPSGEPRGVGLRAGPFLATVATFHYVCFAWIFFRAPSVRHAGVMLGRLGKMSLGHEQISARVALVLGIAVLTHVVPRRFHDGLRERFVRTPALAQGVVLALVAYALHGVAASRAEPFVYGQF